MNKQAGFTLIELAIVLVIIGLLLGGVLRGAELINSAKVKNMAADFKNVQVYVYGYQDKFKALPGDDHQANTHVGGTNASAGTQNGVIEGDWTSQSNPAASEAELFWQHVRLAGLATGPTLITDANYYAKNADGGHIGVQSVSGFTTITKNAAGTASVMSGAYVVCSQGVLGKYAKQLDVTLDDGEGDTGSFRIADPSGGNKSTTSAAVVDSTAYSVCMAF